MGADEYHPISHEGTNLTEAGGIGYTVVDSLDSMLIMGLNEEYNRAKRWIEQKLSFEADASFSTFEVGHLSHRLVPSLTKPSSADYHKNTRRTSFCAPSYRT